VRPAAAPDLTALTYTWSVDQNGEATVNVHNGSTWFIRQLDAELLGPGATMVAPQRYAFELNDGPETAKVCGDYLQSHLPPDRVGRFTARLLSAPADGVRMRLVVAHGCEAQRSDALPPTLLPGLGVRWSAVSPLEV
jgi:hypothetical protein